MLIGTVKTWNETEGWGFAEDNNGYDYFLHISKLRKGQRLRTGDRIKFDVIAGQKGPQANNITKY